MTRLAPLGRAIGEWFDNTGLPILLCLVAVAVCNGAAHLVVRMAESDAGLAMPSGRAFVPSASSQQAVSPVPASLAFAGDE